MVYNKRIDAARKAITTLRLKKLEQSNLSEVITISHQINLAEERLDNDLSLEGIIYNEIRKTSWLSFQRYGDKNSFTPALILTWMDNMNGMPLDVQSDMMIEDYGKEITPTMLADFMVEHDHGLNTYPLRENLLSLRRLFKEVVGFNYDKKFIAETLLFNESNLQPVEDSPF